MMTHEMICLKRQILEEGLKHEKIEAGDVIRSGLITELKRSADVTPDAESGDDFVPYFHMEAKGGDRR